MVIDVEGGGQTCEPGPDPKDDSNDKWNGESNALTDGLSEQQPVVYALNVDLPLRRSPSGGLD